MTDLPSVAVTHELLTDDGIRIAVDHYQHASDHAIVVVHGFAGHTRQPRVMNVLTTFAESAGVIALDLRGHGRSAGRSTVGYLEVLDLQAAVAWAFELGYTSVSTAGFSMGGSIVIRHAALFGSVASVASISGPAFWYYKGTKVMRRLHQGVETRLGRIIVRATLKTRIGKPPWPDPPPLPPVDAAARLGDTPFLVVHGDVDPFFPTEHPEALYSAAANAGVPVELWLEPGFGHAEGAMTEDLLIRIRDWLLTSATERALPTEPEGVG